ncbi:hypothetical protein BL769_RS26090 [Escherichia coli]|nr:hypothetical protein [Escherichia coli]
MNAVNDSIVETSLFENIINNNAYVKNTGHVSRAIMVDGELVAVPESYFTMFAYLLAKATADITYPVVTYISQEANNVLRPFVKSPQHTANALLQGLIALGLVEGDTQTQYKRSITVKLPPVVNTGEINGQTMLVIKTRTNE